MLERIKDNTGQSMALYVIVLTVLLGAMALAIDLGRAFLLRARMQHAADAAALAGVREIPYHALAELAALEYTSRNGFTDGAGGTVVTPYPDPAVSNRYVVEISGVSANFLAPVIGSSMLTVTASAVAEFNAYLPIDINGGGEYGANGVMTLSMFGPYGYYSYGDALSPRWLNDGTPNPDHKPGGYDFMIDVPEDYYSTNGTSIVELQIFDPDTWNNGGDDASPGVRIDEIRPAPGGAHPQPSHNRNTTVYSLYAPDDTPNDYTDDTLIASAEYGPEVSWTDMQWVTPDGFEFNINDFGIGSYRLNVRATDGSSENGFNLRAGPPDTDFNPDNGTNITAVGAIPMNFNDDGLVTVLLGYVAPEAAGLTMHINKFDTDVGAKSVVYHCDTLTGSWDGALSGNGTWQEDMIDIPQGYPGGSWTATYQAGLQDTSVWTMWLEGAIEGQPGFVRLVE